MALGITLLVISIIMFGVAIISYLDNKMGLIGYILVVAAVVALIGAAVLDETKALECVQEVVGFEGASSFHS